MNTLPPDLLSHLRRCQEDFAASSYPQPWDDIVAQFSRGAWGGYKERGEYRAHWLLVREAIAPHRAMVSVAVEDGWRREGLGLRMLEEAEAFAVHELGCSWLTGWLLERNTAALAMDLAFGFEIQGRIPDGFRRWCGTPETILLVAKRL
jgi:GNAT superfamily N-acetyltransferase